MNHDRVIVVGSACKLINIHFNYKSNMAKIDKQIEEKIIFCTTDLYQSPWFCNNRLRFLSLRLGANGNSPLEKTVSLFSIFSSLNLAAAMIPVVVCIKKKLVRSNFLKYLGLPKSNLDNELRFFLTYA